MIQASLEGMDDVRNPYMEEIRTARGRLQRVVDSLLQMSRLESEVLQPHLDWCDLRDVIASAREAAGAPLLHHSVVVHLPESLPLVRLDHNMLAQALANIFHNAAVYTPKDAPIELSVTLRANQLRILIRDHGPGLPVGDETRIFEKFYRSAGSPPGGTGLGLAIAKGFVRGMKGDISARNHPGGGAEFVLELAVENKA